MNTIAFPPSETASVAAYLEEQIKIKREAHHVLAALRRVNDTFHKNGSKPEFAWVRVSAWHDSVQEAHIEIRLTDNGHPIYEVLMLERLAGAQVARRLHLVLLEVQSHLECSSRFLVDHLNQAGNGFVLTLVNR